MSAQEILKELEPLGAESYRKVLRNHGIADPMFGVKIEYLKKIQKRIKKDYQLALELFDTGVYDAMYLAALIADDGKMTRHNLQRWVKKATCLALCANSVAWVAAGSRFGHELGLEWIDSQIESTAVAGWATLWSQVSIKDDTELDLAELKRLLQRIEKTIHDEPDRVRYAMNGFVIAVGTHVQPLCDLALKTARSVGRVSVDMGNTSCQVPFAPDAIDKARERGKIGKKRQSAKC